MKITFDRRKDEANVAKHGVSLALAAELDWEEALVWVDERFDYGEARLIALAPRGGRLFCVAFVVREQDFRIIGLRRANRQEVRHYAEAQ